jgi:AcrR family transcriptional regulator
MARRQPKTNGAPLTTPDVVDAALAFIDQRGLDAFGVRALAASMGISTATLYWHVGNKDQLIAAAAERVFSGLATLDPDKHRWQDVVRHTARACREAVSRHPNLAPVVGSQLVVTAPALHLAELIVRTVEKAGFDDYEVLPVYNSIIGFILGWISIELSSEPVSDGSDAWQAGFEATLRTLDPAVYPAISRHADSLVGRGFLLRWQSGRTASQDLDFEMALDIFLAGLEARAGASRA